MPKHLIFLVHGMGTHPEKWSEGTRKLLTDAYNSYPDLNIIPLEDRFEFVEICYDNIFEDIRKRWKNESESILKVMGANGLDGDLIKKLVEAGQYPSKDNFLWTHVLDVLLYRFAPTVSMAVRVTVANQIMKRLDTGGEIPAWSVLAHSLGTSVAHDTLNDLYHTAVPGKSKLSLSTGDTSAELVMMVANVSRVLELTSDLVYSSYLRPSSTILPDRVCRYYFSVAHRRDPFTWFKTFDPPPPWPDAVSTSNFKALQVRHLLDWNVHDLNHYLKGPQVHIPLFRYLAAAIKKFVDEWQTGSWAKIDEVLENILPHQNGSWTELISSLLKYGALLP